MQKVQRRVIVLVVFLIIALVVSGCGQSQPAKTESERKTHEKLTEIKIGAIYPLTGAAAATGIDLMNGIKLAAEIINGEFPDLNLPLAKTKGLPNLGGAQIKVIFGDHQASAEKGVSEAERLINQEKVVALLGCYHSAVTATASQVAERYGVPFLNPESTSPSLIARNFKWFFRTTPDDDMFAENFFQFLEDMKAKGKVSNPQIALVNENTLWGTDVGKFEKKYAEQYKYKIVADISYPAKSTNVSSEVQKIKAAKPDIIMQASYGSDAILFMKTYKEMDLNVQGLMAMDAGFIDSEFLKTLGKDGNYILSREVWSLDLAKNKPIVEKVNKMYRERFGTDMNGNSARTFTGLLALADAINRAGSTKPEDIRKALAATDIPGDQLIMPWKGIKFDQRGQNVLGAGIIVQVQDQRYWTVWPWNLAAREVIWPTPEWSKRK